MSGVLDAILTQKRREIEALKARSRAAPAAGVLASRGGEVVSRLRRGAGELRLLTEIKRKSPSAGPLSTVLSVAERARVYASGGVAMISVLADETFFDGSWAYVAEARREVGDVLVLAKEFVLDELQISEAAAVGADSVLLIVRCLDAARLKPLVDDARAKGLEPLVEIVDEAELDLALAAGASVIGVNARDLDTLKMDAARSARVLSRIPESCVRLHLSGVKSADDVAAGLKRHARIWTVMGWSTEFFRCGRHRVLGFDSMQAFVDQFMTGYFGPMDPNNLLTMAWKWQRGDVSRHTGGDLAEALGRIKAKTFVMPISHDMFFPPSDCVAEQQLIPNSEFRPVSSIDGHLALFGTDAHAIAEVDSRLRELLTR